MGIGPLKSRHMRRLALGLCVCAALALTLSLFSAEPAVKEPAKGIRTYLWPTDPPPARKGRERSAFPRSDHEAPDGLAGRAKGELASDVATAARSGAGTRAGCSGDQSFFPQDLHGVFSGQTHPWLFPRPLHELRPLVVPNQVAYVWCRNITFGFQHYLSVLSAWKMLEPDKLEIHATADMLSDNYNQWLTELAEDVPSLEIVTVNRPCGDALEYGLEILHDRGGILLDFSTVLLMPVHHLRRHSLALADGRAAAGGGIFGFVASTARNPHLQQIKHRAFWDNLEKIASTAMALDTSRSSIVPPEALVRCSALRRHGDEGLLLLQQQEPESEARMEPRGHGTLPDRVPPCTTLPHDLDLRPLDLWWSAKRGRGGLSVLKDLYYLDLGLDEGLEPPASQEASAMKDEVREGKRPGDEAEDGHDGQQATDRREDQACRGAIPFIVHYVWFGSAEFSFRMYMSFLSTIHVAGAKRVFLHTDMLLTGPYWQAVSRHPKVTLVYRERPSTIYGHRILYTQHLSDVVRADLLDRFGGVYVDWDVLWLRSPAPLLAAAAGARWGTLLNLDHMPRPGFRDVLNMGVVAARPRASFIRLWRRRLRHYRPRDFFYNALELPYKVLERYPYTARVEKRLQVMCFYLKCHPIFHPDYRDWQHSQPFDWKSDAYSIHFTHPDPEEYDSLEKLKSSNGTFAEIGLFILDISNSQP